MSTIEVKVPDIGDFKDVPVIEMLVKRATRSRPRIARHARIDKATMEVPAPAAGVVKELKVKVGDKVSEGTLISDARRRRGAAAPAAAPALRPRRPRPRQPRRRRAGAAAPAPRGGGTVEVNVPDIGDFKDVPVIEVLVKAGDTVEGRADSLVTLESTRRRWMCRRPPRGVVKELKVKVGDKVSRRRRVIAAARTAAAAPPPRPRRRRQRRQPAGAAGGTREPSRSASACTGADARRSAAAPRRRRRASRRAHASPSVRKFARELGVDLSQGQGQRARRAASCRKTCRTSSRGVLTRRRRPRQPAAAPAAAAAARTCCRGRRSTSPSSARSKQSRCRGSRRSPARTCTATG